MTTDDMIKYCNDETISDIIREIREDANMSGPVKAIPNSWVMNWSYRIEDAAKRSRCGCVDSCEHLRELERENFRIREALEVVLNVKFREIKTAHGTGIYADGDTFNAVRTAQRIWNGSEAK